MRVILRLMMLSLAAIAVTGADTQAEDATDESKAIEKIELLGGSFRTSISLPGHPVTAISFLEKSAKPYKPAALIRFNDKHVLLLKFFPHLAAVSLTNTAVTDAGLKELQGLEKLTFLNLAETKVTDAGLKDLAQVQQLTCLNLSKTRITDAGLKELSKMTRLTRLNLNNTEITDAGLKELAELKTLEFLELRGTKATADGISLFKQSLPNIKVILNVDRRGDHDYDFFRAPRERRGMLPLDP